MIADRHLSRIENWFWQDLKERHAALSLDEPNRADEKLWLVHEKHGRCQISCISDDDSINEDFRERLHAKQADLIFYNERAFLISLKSHRRLDYLYLRVVN